MINTNQSYPLANYTLSRNNFDRILQSMSPKQGRQNQLTSVVNSCFFLTELGRLACHFVLKHTISW